MLLTKRASHGINVLGRTLEPVVNVGRIGPKSLLHRVQSAAVHIEDRSVLVGGASFDEQAGTGLLVFIRADTIM